MSTKTFDFVSVEKSHIFSKMTTLREIDTLEATPNVWAMSLVRIKNGFVTIKTGKGRRTFPSGLYGSFLPPFSFIEYQGRFERMDMTTVSSAVQNPLLPSVPVVFPLDTEARFPAVQDVCDWLRASIERLQTEPVPIARGDNPSGISLKIKRVIDTSYASPLKFSELAKRLNLSQALMTMHFKRGFYLPPVKYRNCLRLIDALIRLTHAARNEKRIIDIAEEVGFGDLSQFNRQFKSYFGASPRAFVSLRLSD